MALTKVLAVRISCDRIVDEQPCPARILVDNPGLTAEEIRVIAVERGWGCVDGEELCPRHRL